MKLPVTALCGALLVAALPAAPQAAPPQAPAPEAPVVRQSVEVKAVDLDVVATGKDGRPVEDLTREELTVKVDGRPFPLDYFARVAAGTLHGPDLATASPDLILETTRNENGQRYLPRQFLVFFDDAHLLPPERSRVIEGLRDFVTRLAPSDSVSLSAYGTTTRVYVPFTSSKEDLLDGLDRLAKTAPAGLRYESDFRLQTSDIRRARYTSRPAMVRNVTEEAYVRDRATLEEIRRSVAALGARPGKRVFLYVSDGIELRPGQTMAQAFGTSLQEFDRNVFAEFHAVVAEANRAGVTMDVLDAKGLTVDGVDAGQALPSPFSSFLASENLREPLQGFARETGGVLVTNRNEFGPGLDRIYQASTTYYSVGVTLAGLDPRVKEHKVDVATTRAGVTLRTRRTVGVRTPDEAARNRVELALINPATAGDFPAVLKLGPAQKGGGLGHRVVPFEVTVAAAALTPRVENGKRVAAVEVALAAVSDNGERSPVTASKMNANLEPTQPGAPPPQTWTCTGQLKSGKGNVRFVATVRDLATDRMGVASASAHVE